MLKTNTGRLRLCVSCRSRAPQSELIRLTVDFASGQVHLNPPDKGAVHGRSAYLCKKTSCLEQVLKGTRLKVALTGQIKKGKVKKRTIQWPLEPQLIKDVERLCTEPLKRCENTLKKEGNA